MFDLGGKGRIYNSYNNHLIIDPQAGYYAPALYPANNNTIWLGKDDNRFSRVYCVTLYEGFSDIKYKENIRDLDGALDIIMGMRGVRFDFKKEFAYNDSVIIDLKEIEKLDKERKDNIGFIAQELIEVLPTAVHIDDSTGTYNISYTRIIPVLVEAMQEQQLIIEELQEKLKDKEEKSANEKSAGLPVSTGTLEQNYPNPFTESTTIAYALAEDVQTARISIYNMNGTQLKSIPLHQTGEGSIEIAGGELQAGMYMYSLIVDGKLVDTRTMILTD